MSDIHVHIERLIIEGQWGISLSASALQEAFEAGLVRMLGTPGTASALGRTPPDRRAPTLMESAHGDPGSFGAQLSEAVYHTLIQPGPAGPGAPASRVRPAGGRP